MGTKNDVGRLDTYPIGWPRWPDFPQWPAMDQVWKSADVENLWESTKAFREFPPVNILKTDNNKYVIEMAVAGFGKNELEISLEGNTLTVSGKKISASIPEQNYYLFKGIAERAFSRSFNLQDKTEIKNAELVNGMLKIWLDALSVDVTKKTIPINETEPATKAELLVEKDDQERFSDDGNKSDNPRH